MEQVFSYIIALGASVMMPIIFTIIGMCIGMKFGKALKSGLFVGVGFVGLGCLHSGSQCHCQYGSAGVRADKD